MEAKPDAMDGSTIEPVTMVACIGTWITREKERIPNGDGSLGARTDPVFAGSLTGSIDMPHRLPLVRVAPTVAP